MRQIVGKNSQLSGRKLFFGNFLFGILVAIARGEAKRRGSRTSILTWKVVLSMSILPVFPQVVTLAVILFHSVCMLGRVMGSD